MLQQLDSIIDDAITNNDRIGYFAYLYRRVTAQILKEVQLKNFEDNERMEKFDVAFANYYLDAYYGYINNTPISKSWAFAFQNKKEQLTILQHIMLGINTHINLDLGLAVSAEMHGKEISEIENDFTKVNSILASIVNEMQDRLSRVSSMLFLLDLAGKNTDEKIINFSMQKAREFSWHNGNLLWGLGTEHQDGAIHQMDLVVLGLGQFIKAPKSKIIDYMLGFITRFEEKNVGVVISKLREE
ncbi:hypothetical protein LCGC14_0129160 [marine sediment metagenome]|uniref:Uncharacterized protein n=1 Tax=marine sediment metagenome TaxID=412755 RepID=A0A0F9V841_9ZZZZ|nr:DUF5995 family protein [Maribacter sp.]HDZ06116.1 hypothetical protein [Maribacter sp.]HEA80828.1 hypothetical protein [Maribacter sp.]